MRGMLPIRFLPGTMGCNTEGGAGTWGQRGESSLEKELGKAHLLPHTSCLTGNSAKGLFLTVLLFFLESYRHLIMPLHMCQNFLNFK